MVKEDRRFFFLGMNQDDDPRYVKEGEYISGNNIYTSNTDNGNDNAAENIKDTLEVAYTFPSGGVYKCINIQDDEENKRSYLFIWNSEGNHHILYYDYISKSVKLLIRDNFYNSSVWTDVDYTVGDVVIRNSVYYICKATYTVAGFSGRRDPSLNSTIWGRIGDYLNFQEDNFLNSTIIIRDGQTLLFWTDNHNEPKYINVDKKIDGDYPSVIQPKHIDLCPLQPLYEPYIEMSSSLNDNNNVGGRFYQFRYRWVFDDDMYGAWSPISEMLTYDKNTLSGIASSDSEFRIEVPRDSTVESRIKRIQLAARECRSGNSGNWFQILDLDATDESIFATYPTAGANGYGYTSGGTTYECYYIFNWDNTSERLALDQDETNQLFSYVPKKAGTISVTEDNRLVFGDVTESLDVSSVNLDMTPTYNYDTASLSSTDDSYLKGLKTGITYKWGVRYSDSKGRLSAVLTSDSLSKYVEFYDGSANYPCISNLEMLIGHAPPEDAETWQLCYLPNGVDYNGSTPLAYQFALGAETTTVDVNGTNTHCLADLQVVRTFNTDYKDSQFPLSFDENYYVRGVLGSTGTSDWGQYDESKVIETVDSGSISSIIVSNGGTTYTSVPTVTAVGGGGEGASFTAVITGNTITSITINNGGTGYTSTPTIRISGGGATDGTAFVSKMDYFKYLKFDITNWGTTPTFQDIIEVYRKSSDLDNGIWREFGYPCRVGFDSNGVRAHLGLDNLRDGQPAPSIDQVVGTTDLDYSLTGSGDMYVGLITQSEDSANYPPKEFENRNVIGDYYLEVPFADVLLESRSTDLKRPLVSFEQDSLPSLNTTLRWSNPLVQNSNINGLGFFYDVNFRELKNEYGTIRNIFAENEYLKIFFDRKVALLPMGRTELNSLNGNNLVSATSEVFGTPRYTVQDYGVSDNPESVSTFGGATMFVDRNKNSVLLSSGIDVVVISDFGMKFFFDEVFIRSQRLINKPVIQSVYDKEFDNFLLSVNNKLKSRGVVSIDSPTQITITLTESQIIELESNKDITLTTFTVSPSISETVTTWSKVSATSIQATVTNSATYNPSTPVDVIQGEQYVLAYSVKSKKWISFFDFKGDVFGSAGNQLASYKDSKFYLHNDDSVSSYGNFYGTQYESSIEIPFVSEPASAKNPRTIELESVNDEFYMESGTNERGQSTSLINSDFETKEGRQWSNILMDENTPLVGGITNPITEGDLIIGTYFIAKIKNTSTSLVKLFSSSLRYIVSRI